MLKNIVTIMFIFFILNSFTNIKYEKKDKRPDLIKKIRSTLSFEASVTSEYFINGQYINDILDYYDLKYNKALLDYKKKEIDYPKAEPIIEIEGRVLRYKYRVTENKSYNITISSLWIPLSYNAKIMNFNPIVFGDLNNDNLEDCIIQTHSEGAFGGGNSYTRDVFVFINTGDSYQFKLAINHSKLLDVNSLSNLDISNGLFIADSSNREWVDAWNYSDIVKRHYYKYKDNTLKLIKSKKLSKTNYRKTDNGVIEL